MIIPVVTARTVVETKYPTARRAIFLDVWTFIAETPGKHSNLRCGLQTLESLILIIVRTRSEQ